MKNLILTHILVALTLCGLAQDKTTVKLSGKIINPSSDTILIEDGWGEQFHITTLAKDGTFSTEFKIETGYYYLSDLNESTTIYLGENYDLDITLDTDSFDESLIYKGKGADANNYLAKKALMEESWGSLDYYGHYCRISQSSFLQQTDTLNNIRFELLKDSRIKDMTFYNLEKQHIKCERMYRLNLYPRAHKLLTENKNYKPSSDYPFPFANLELNDSSMIPSPMFLSSIIDYMDYNRDSALYLDLADYPLYMLESLNRNIENIPVKMNAMHQFCRNYLTSSNRMDECFEIYKSIETDQDRLAVIQAKYLARKKTQKGATSPPFAYENPEGKIVTHQDLKGKLVYIDLWATWCGPCLREIPYFDTLQEAFKDRDITFVSICQNDTKERWKQAVEIKNLKGLQLYAEGDGGQFYEDYQVTGIPRYIILDAEGKNNRLRC